MTRRVLSSVVCSMIVLLTLSFCLSFSLGAQSSFSTDKVQSLLNVKTRNLQEIRDALMEASILSEACETFGNSSSMYASYSSRKSAASSELTDLVSVLEYEVDCLSKLYKQMNLKRIEEEKNVERQQKEAERLAKAEAAKALAEKQAAETKAKALEKQVALANDSGDLQVIGASWGKNDVLSAVQSILRNGNGKSFTPSSSQLGDGLPGWKKVLYVVLKSKSTEQFYSVVVTEGSSFSTVNRQALPTPSVGRNGISIIGANYGPSDVTSKVKSIYSTGSIGANNNVFGDTWPFVYKTMTIVYMKGSSYYTTIGMENQNLL